MNESTTTDNESRDSISQIDEVPWDRETTPRLTPGKINASCTGRVLRIFLLVYNGVLLIFSLGVIGGASYNSTEKVFVLLDTWFTPALVLATILLILSLVGGLGALTQGRCILWVYVILMVVFGLIIMIVSSYALSKTNDGAEFLTMAWRSSPGGIRQDLQTTFECCGLNAYLDTDAELPCPAGLVARNGTAACMPPMLEQFEAYSTGVPGFGLFIFFLMIFIAGVAWCLIRSIALAATKRSVDYF